MLEPSKQDLRYYKIRPPEAFNSLYLDYEVILATDTFLSIYFEGYSYGRGAAHSVQYSFVVNYDLVSYRILNSLTFLSPGQNTWSSSPSIALNNSRQERMNISRKKSLHLSPGFAQKLKPDHCLRLNSNGVRKCQPRVASTLGTDNRNRINSEGVRERFQR